MSFGNDNLSFGGLPVGSGNRSSSATTSTAFSLGNPVSQGFNFGASTIRPTLSFSTPSTSAPLFGTQTSNPPTFGTSAGNLAKPVAVTGMFGSAPANNQNAGSGSSSALFSGFMAPKTAASTLTSNNSLFGASTTASYASFSFGSSIQAAKPSGPGLQTSASATPLFGSSVQPIQPGGFGLQTSTSSTPLFGSSGQPTQPGGLASQTTTSSTPLFGSSGQASKPGWLGLQTSTSSALSFSSTQSTNSGLKFGASESYVGTGKQGLSFGSATSSTAPTPGQTNFTFGGSTSNTTLATSLAPGFKLGGASSFVQAKSTAPTLQLASNAVTSSTSQTTSGFSFGAGNGVPSTVSKSSTSINLPLGQSSTGFNLSGQIAGQLKTTTSTSSPSTLSQPRTIGTGTFGDGVTGTQSGQRSSVIATTTTKPSLGFSLPHTTATTSGFKLSGSTTASTSFGFQATTSVASTSSITSATSGSLTANTSSEKFTYKQLEDLVNKWNIELEDMERGFLEQAAQINVADRELMENGEKITLLHHEVEKAKLEQKRLDQELDFLVSQQIELEELLKPLEESVKQHGPDNFQEPDREREKIYSMAEKCDGQLKGMVQDLRDIIDYLNSTNASHQDDNPVVQIAKILNVHMDSLHWIDQNSALLQKRVDEIGRMSELRRKEHERFFRMRFDE
ncbi:nuclear pore glycoprotein p62-like [Xenia sp. Carnegie-2017]|uniref:nuclear pore glycoprotein p62-like n=1 Tax=Xenia sp. Carnegie-2017 TaxID=2897299 RepID=UPI001F04C6C8|nr:nuclear pore glycoprotein p62-like [Xenia sp. Carnegie-2017]